MLRRHPAMPPMIFPAREIFQIKDENLVLVVFDILRLAMHFNWL